MVGCLPIDGPAGDGAAVEPPYVVAAYLTVVVAVEPVAGQIGDRARHLAADRELVGDVRVEPGLQEEDHGVRIGALAQRLDADDPVVAGTEPAVLAR